MKRTKSLLAILSAVMLMASAVLSLGVSAASVTPSDGTASTIVDGTTIYIENVGGNADKAAWKETDGNLVSPKDYDYQAIFFDTGSALPTSYTLSGTVSYSSISDSAFFTIIPATKGVATGAGKDGTNNGKTAVFAKEGANDASHLYCTNGWRNAGYHWNNNSKPHQTADWYVISGGSGATGTFTFSVEVTTMNGATSMVMTINGTEYPAYTPATSAAEDTAFGFMVQKIGVTISDLSFVDNTLTCQHNYGNAVCTDMRICTVCGYAVPAGEHTWNNADCTTPKTCSVCGATEGEAVGHSWTDATCQTPKTCSVCGATEGEIGTHNYVSGTCSVCGTASTTAPGGNNTTTPGGNNTTTPGGDNTTTPGGNNTTVPGGNTTVAPPTDYPTAEGDASTIFEDTTIALDCLHSLAAGQVNSGAWKEHSDGTLTYVKPLSSYSGYDAILFEDPNLLPTSYEISGTLTVDKINSVNSKFCIIFAAWDLASDGWQNVALAKGTNINYNNGFFPAGVAWNTPSNETRNWTLPAAGESVNFVVTVEENIITLYLDDVKYDSYTLRESMDFTGAYTAFGFYSDALNVTLSNLYFGEIKSASGGNAGGNTDDSVGGNSGNNGENNAGSNSGDDEIDIPIIEDEEIDIPTIEDNNTTTDPDGNDATTVPDGEGITTGLGGDITLGTDDITDATTGDSYPMTDGTETTPAPDTGDTTPSLVVAVLLAVGGLICASLAAQKKKSAC